MDGHQFGEYLCHVFLVLTIILNFKYEALSLASTIKTELMSQLLRADTSRRLKFDSHIYIKVAPGTPSQRKRSLAHFDNVLPIRRVQSICHRLDNPTGDGDSIT